ncbi:acyl carrier protein [Streptomyces sp. NPDC006879]|uniref:acyl carrier protein n=1 Tax=Streptomyces sp. NPDC006879 TaxID=3364767 RepID=UPI0036D091E7
MLEQQEVQDIIESEIRALLLGDEDAPDFTLDDELLRIGLNSLMLAQLLIQLEAELGVDPFGEQLSIADIRTIRDLIAAYDDAIRSVPAEV